MIIFIIGEVDNMLAFRLPVFFHLLLPITFFCLVALNVIGIGNGSAQRLVVFFRKTASRFHTKKHFLPQEYLSLIFKRTNEFKISILFIFYFHHISIILKIVKNNYAIIVIIDNFLIFFF